MIFGRRIKYVSTKGWSMNMDFIFPSWAVYFTNLVSLCFISYHTLASLMYKGKEIVCTKFCTKVSLTIMLIFQKYFNWLMPKLNCLYVTQVWWDIWFYFSHHTSDSFIKRCIVRADFFSPFFRTIWHVALTCRRFCSRIPMCRRLRRSWRRSRCCSDRV